MANRKWCWKVVTREGADPVILLSNPRLSDQSCGQDGRLIYSLREPPPNQYDSNLWQLRFDPATRQTERNSRRLTDWTGFFFNNPELTERDGKRSSSSITRRRAMCMLAN